MVESGEPISEANLERLVELSRWGKGSALDLAWSPAGNILAVASQTGIYLYEYSGPDLATSRELIQSVFLDAGLTRRLVFSPQGFTTPAQNQLISAGDQVLRWDLPTGLSQVLVEKPSALSVQVSADGLNVALLSQPNGKSAVFQFNQKDGVELQDSQAPLFDAVISPDLKWICAHPQGGSPRIWRADGKKLLDLPAETQDPGPLAFSPDSQTLAVAYPDTQNRFTNTNFVRLYTLPGGQPLHQFFPLGSNGIAMMLVSLAFAPDGRSIAAGCADNTIHIWPTSPGPADRTLTARAFPTPLAFSPDGLLLASGGLDVFLLATGALQASTDAHAGPVHDLVLSPDGKLAALARFEHIELRQVSDGSLVRSIPSPRQVNGLAYSPDGALLCGACSDGTARIWRIRDGRFLTLIGLPTFRQWACAFSPDNQTILISGENGLIQFYEIEKDLITRQVKEPYLATRLVFSPVGTLFASLTSAGANIRDSMGRLTRTTAGVGLQDMAFSPDGGWLALAGNEILRMFDLGTGLDVYSVYNPSRGQPTALAYSADGAFLAVGTEQGPIDLYWAGDGTYLRTLEGHHGRVIRLCFSPDTLRLLSAGQDGTLRLWGIR